MSLLLRCFRCWTVEWSGWVSQSSLFRLGMTSIKICWLKREKSFILERGREGYHTLGKPPVSPSEACSFQQKAADYRGGYSGISLGITKPLPIYRNQLNLIEALKKYIERCMVVGSI